MRADLKLVPRLLVHVWTPQNGEFLDLVWKRDRATHVSASALCGVNDLLGRGIEPGSQTPSGGCECFGLQP